MADWMPNELAELGRASQIELSTGRDAVDAAYREKYGAASSYVETTVRDDVAATTLRLSPK